MTKKLFLIPLLVAPLLLASCGESKPGAFEQGDNVLTAELIRKVVEETKDETDAPKKISEVKLQKQLKDAEGATVWADVTSDFAGADNAGFIVFKKSVTVEAVTTFTYEAYAEKSLKLIASWTNTTDPEAMSAYEAEFETVSGGGLQVGVFGLAKLVYVMKDEVKTLDHFEAVQYDEFGHKLVEYSQSVEVGTIPQVSEIRLTKEDYGEKTYINRKNVAVLTIRKWNNNHYEDLRYVYSKDMAELKAETEAELFPDGVYKTLEKEFTVDEVKYTVSTSNDYKIIVHKDGVEEPVAKISTEVYNNAAMHMELDHKFIYALKKEVASTTEDFTYLERDYTNKIDKKIKQEIHCVDLTNGEDKMIETKYVVDAMKLVVELEEGDAGLVTVSELREDKTVDPLTSRTYIVDSELVLHDNITNSLLKNIAQTEQSNNIVIVGKGYYNTNNSTFYNEMLEPVSELALPSDSSYQGYFKVLGGDKIVVKNTRTGYFGIFNLEGKEVVPFILKAIGEEIDGVCVVRNVDDKVGLLAPATGLITWLDYKDQEVGLDDVVYVKHNVAAEGEPEEYHYKTYFYGKLMGDFDHKMLVEEADDSYGAYRNLYREVKDSETDLSRVLTYTLWVAA